MFVMSERSVAAVSFEIAIPHAASASDDNVSEEVRVNDVRIITTTECTTKMSQGKLRKVYGDSDVDLLSAGEVT